MNLTSFLFENDDEEDPQTLQDYLDEHFAIPDLETLQQLFAREKELNPKFWFREVSFPNPEKQVFVYANKAIRNHYDQLAPQYVLEFDGSEFYQQEVDSWFRSIIDQGRSEEYLGQDFEQEENEEFWSSPVPLYHAVKNREYLESVLKNGLEPRNETRGMTNQHIGAAVFTSVDWRNIFDYQGEDGGILEINTKKMKQDGYTPFITSEPEVLEKKMEEILAHRIGITVDSDYSDPGMHPDTVIVHGKIPLKYLRQLQPHEMENLSEIVQEPKRQSPKTLQQLDIQRNAGIRNILAIYNDAEPEEKEYWGKWYHMAHENVKELADRFGITFPAMAAAVAVLSPGNRWSSNLVAAERVLMKFRDPAYSGRINAYGRNVEKALKILQTGDLGVVSGPKVTVFFKSLLDPKAVENDMVLDTHAINIWRGMKQAIKATAMPTQTERAQMISDYQEAARQLGVPVQAVQAVTWFVWRYTAKPIVLKPQVVKVEKTPRKKKSSVQQSPELKPI